MPKNGKAQAKRTHCQKKASKQCWQAGPELLGSGRKCNVGIATMGLQVVCCQGNVAQWCATVSTHGTCGGLGQVDPGLGATVALLAPIAIIYVL